MKIFFSAFGWAVDDDDKHCKYAYLHLSRASQVADKRQSAMRIEGDGIVRRDMMCQHCRTLGPLRVCDPFEFWNSLPNTFKIYSDALDNKLNQSRIRAKPVLSPMWADKRIVISSVCPHTKFERTAFFFS